MSVMDQASKAMKLCRKLRSSIRIVKRRNITGNLSDADELRNTVGLFNEVIESSHCYDVLCNKNYVFDKDFPYHFAYKWLYEKTTKPDPVECENKVKDNFGTAAHAVISLEEVVCVKQRIGEKHVLRQNTAREAKVRQRVENRGDDVIATP